MLPEIDKQRCLPLIGTDCHCHFFFLGNSPLENIVVFFNMVTANIGKEV